MAKEDKTDPLIDKVTGRRMLEDSVYSTYGTWVLWAQYQYDPADPDNDGICCYTLTGKDSDPTFVHTLDPEDCPRGEFIKLGEFEGNGLDSKRWMNDMLGYEPYIPAETEFEDYYNDE